MLSNYDLIQNKNKYTLSELISNIDKLDKKIVLNTQTLTEEFCVEYILDIRIDSGDEDSYLFCEDYILTWQPHIDEKKLIELRNIKYKDFYNFQNYET